MNRKVQNLTFACASFAAVIRRILTGVGNKRKLSRQLGRCLTIRWPYILGFFVFQEIEAKMYERRPELMGDVREDLV